MSPAARHRLSAWRPILLWFGVAAVAGATALALAPALRVRAVNAGTWILARAAPAALPAWQRRITPSLPPGAVLVVGDSLAAQLPPRLVDPLAVNLGLGGIRTAELADQLASRPAPVRARAVVLIVGTNDLVAAPAVPPGLAAALDRLLDTLPPAVPVVLCAVPPVDPRVQKKRLPAVIAAANTVWSRLAAARPAVRFLPLAPALADAEGRLRADLHAGDGLHLNAAGNAALGALIRSALPAARS